MVGIHAFPTFDPKDNFRFMRIREPYLGYVYSSCLLLPPYVLSIVLLNDHAFELLTRLDNKNKKSDK